MCLETPVMFLNLHTLCAPFYVPSRLFSDVSTLVSAALKL